MTLAELQAARQAAIDKAEALAVVENPTPEQSAECDELLNKVGDIDGQIKALKESAKAQADRRAKIEEAQKGQRRTSPTVANDLKVGKDRREDDPAKGFRNPREFFSNVLAAGRGARMDERLIPLRATAGSDEHGVYDDSHGGFLVPEAFSPNLLSLQAEADPIGAATLKVPMASSTVRIPARVDKNHVTSVSGGLTVGRRAEAVAATASRMELERVELRADSLFGLTYVTEELLQDSPISVVALLEAGFRDEFTARLIDERINGTGVGQFLGVLNSPCLVTVAKETGQAADTIVYENVIKVRARCWGYGSAFWIANHDTIPQLMLMNQAVGTGGIPVWQPSAREDHPDTLLGRPIVFTEYADTVGDAGDIILGNWSQYLEGQYQQQGMAESIHVRFVEHERAFKFWVRNAGAPWWRSALTPKNSASTLSPFVTLAARA